MNKFPIDIKNNDIKIFDFMFHVDDRIDCSKISTENINNLIHYINKEYKQNYDYIGDNFKIKDSKNNDYYLMHDGGGLDSNAIYYILKDFKNIKYLCIDGYGNVQPVDYNISNRYYIENYNWYKSITHFTSNRWIINLICDYLLIDAMNVKHVLYGDVDYVNTYSRYRIPQCDCFYFTTFNFMHGNISTLLINYIYDKDNIEKRLAECGNIPKIFRKICLIRYIEKYFNIKMIEKSNSELFDSMNIHMSFCELYKSIVLKHPYANINHNVQQFIDGIKYLGVDYIISMFPNDDEDKIKSIMEYIIPYKKDIIRECINLEELKTLREIDVQLYHHLNKQLTIVNKYFFK